MNPELPAEEEMKKPSTPPWPHSLVSCELCPVTDRKSAKKCSLPPLHRAVRPGCRGPLWMGNVDAGAWSQEPTGLRAFLALAESSSGTQDRREPAGDQALLDSQWVTLRGNKGLLGGVCRWLHGRQRGAEGPKADQVSLGHPVSMRLAAPPPGTARARKANGSCKNPW